MELLDIDSFIIELEQRPSIWDISSQDYSNREKKRNAWEELVNIFAYKDASLEEKKQFGQHLQRRWKSLRDSYSRELKIQKELKSGSGSRKRPVYIYFKQLSFLEKVVALKTTENSLEEKQPEEEELPSAPEAKKAKKAKNQADIVGERLVSAVEKSVQLREDREKEQESDCDRMFLLSLLQPLKKIPEHARFGVKRKIMGVIEEEMKMHHLPSGDYYRNRPTTSTPQTYTQLQNIPQHFARSYPTDYQCAISPTQSSSSAQSPFSEIDIFESM